MDKIKQRIIEILENLIKGAIYNNTRIVPESFIEKRLKTMVEITATQITIELREDIKQDILGKLPKEKITGDISYCKSDGFRTCQGHIEPEESKHIDFNQALTDIKKIINETTNK